ncbi:hypothetical protein CK203_086876 [Vitis vinifera]|uniref:Uncharacterized protein n=1 Tax=Vitis vinifera TaxID=29760 RepID=A0A438EAD1_VITVI|nr:hypothetical protein CK203_086876 [Vitis vinifera]
MDSSQVLGDEAEECSSSESGWTTYIASPDHHHEVDDDENDKEKTDKTDNDDDGDDDDDNDHDSMASDASSGHPTHPQLTCESSKGSHGIMTQYKHAEDETPSKSPSGKQPCKRVGRKRDEKTKVDINQEWVLDSNSERSCSHVQSGPKKHVTRREELLDFHPVVVLVKLLDLLPTWGLRAE